MTESTLAAIARAAAEQPTPPAVQASASASTVLDPTALATALMEGVSEGVKAERSRVKSILTAEAAKDRSDLAHYFAFDTDMSAEQAVAALDKAPKATAETNGFLATMRAEPNPNLGTGAAAGSPAKPTQTLAERAAARHGVTANASR